MVRIRHFELRYRLPESRPGDRDRIDGVARRMLQEALEPALARAGIDTERHMISIRRIEVPIHLRAAMTDSEMIRAWSQAFAAAMVRALQAGASAEIVVYRSHHQGLLDMADSIHRGNTARAWAWRQLGLWQATPPVSPAGAASELHAALIRNPESAVTVLVVLAESSGLAGISQHWTARMWQELAAAITRRTIAVDAETPSGTSADSTVVHRQLRSELAMVLRRWVGSRRDNEAVRTAWTLAGIVVVQAEPGSASWAESRWKDAVRRRAVELLELTPPAARALNTRSLPEPAAGERRSPERSTAPSHQRKEERPDTEFLLQPGALREPAWTRFGGLLFSLHLVAAWEEELFEQASSRGRSWRWWLHQLAMALTTATPEDPAALAFCGLLPGSETPDAGEPEAAEEELEALQAWRIRFEDALAERLPPGRDLLSKVCQRAATVEGDPGWIELHFPLDSVSIDIRRAGLDLDPGYVPWLGTVVRFVYE